MTAARPLVVVYDKGAVHPAEAHLGLTPLAPLVFLVADTPPARRLVPLMQQFGETILLGDDREADARRVAQTGPAGIVTFSERMLPTTAVLAESLGLPFHSVKTTSLLTDKFEQRRQLGRAGVDLTRVRRLSDPSQWDEAVDAVGLPAVLKPAWGGGSRDTHLIQDRAVGAAIASRLLAGGGRAALVLEQFHPGQPSHPYGDYVSVESATVLGTVAHLAVTGKFSLAPPFRELGQFWPAPVDEDTRTEVLDLTSRALVALGVQSGITHTEIKLTPDGPRLIEVNGRLGGHINELSKRALGVDMVHLAGGIALGREVALPRARTDRVFWQYNNPAPTADCTLEKIDGGTDLVTIPGITSYTPYVRPGDRLAAGVMTNALDVICGDADDHASMFAQIDAALARLSFTFGFAAGVRTVPAGLLVTE